MALLQALIALISRSAGKIFSALFGWAVGALFGETTKKDRTKLSVVVAAAAAWPLLVLGVIAPKVAALVIAFVPIPRRVPSGWIRIAWVVLALIVPFVVGRVFAKRGRTGAWMQETGLKKHLRGFPITLGVAGAFLVVLVVTPFRKLTAMIRGLRDEQIALLVPPHCYHAVADQVGGVLGGHGFRLQRREASLAMRAPTAILRYFGGAALRGFIPDRLEVFESPDLLVVLHPNGITLRGKEKVTARAHGLLSEALTRCDVLQTMDPAAQALEKQIRDVWRVYDENPERHAGSRVLAARLREIAGDLAVLPVDYVDWQILYRQALQLSRALAGEPQLLAHLAPKVRPTGARRSA